MLRIVSPVILWVLLSVGVAWGDSLPRSVQEGWTWPVAVIPSSQGWDVEPGLSVAPAVEFARGQVNDSVMGIREHDVFFRLEPPVTDAAKRLRDWRNDGFLAVISFAEPETNRQLVKAWSPGDPVLLLADDAETSLRDDAEIPKAGVFALQLHKSYLSRAVTEAYGVLLPSDSEVALLSDVLAASLSQAARATASGLRDRRLSAQVFWVAGGGVDSYKMMAQEMMGYGAEAIVLWMDQVAVRELYHQIRAVSPSVAIWAAGPDPQGIVGLDGIMTADQDRALEMDTTTKALKMDIWDATRIHVQDRPIAAKAYACCRWVFKAFELVGEATPDSVAWAMARSTQIPLGAEIINASSVTHRPASRVVTVVRAKDGRWEAGEILSLAESGPGYYYDAIMVP